MNRRDLLLVGASTALAHGVTSAMGCAAQTSASASTILSGANADARAAAMDAIAECQRVGQACFAHCIQLLSEGNAAMGDCAKACRDMLAVCEATGVLASSGSDHLAALAAVCVSTCRACEATCHQHAGHHEECAACEQACRACAEACAALTA